MVVSGFPCMSVAMEKRIQINCFLLILLLKTDGDNWFLVKIKCVFSNSCRMTSMSRDWSALHLSHLIGSKIVIDALKWSEHKNHQFFTISCQLKTYQNYQHLFQKSQNSDFQSNFSVLKIGGIVLIFLIILDLSTIFY